MSAKDTVIEYLIRGIHLCQLNGILETGKIPVNKGYDITITDGPLGNADGTPRTVNMNHGVFMTPAFSTRSAEDAITARPGIAHPVYLIISLDAVDGTVHISNTWCGGVALQPFYNCGILSEFRSYGMRDLGRFCSENPHIANTIPMMYQCECVAQSPIALSHILACVVVPFDNTHRQRLPCTLADGQIKTMLVPFDVDPVKTLETVHQLLRDHGIEMPVRIIDKWPAIDDIATWTDIA